MLVVWFSVLLFLLLVTKWQALGKLLRHAIALVVLDKGFVVLAQISMSVLAFLCSEINDKKISGIIMLVSLLYQMISYPTILYRLYGIKTNNQTGILNCYIFSLRRLGHFFLLLIPVFIFAIASLSAVKGVEVMLFKSFGINFFSTSICTLTTYLFFGVFSYFTYFLFILVIVEQNTIYKAININYQMMMKLPFSLIIQLTALMILPGPLLNMDQLFVNITVYLWILLGTSLSVVIYSDQKEVMPKITHSY